MSLTSKLGSIKRQQSEFYSMKIMISHNQAPLSGTGHEMSPTTKVFFLFKLSSNQILIRWCQAIIFSGICGWWMSVFVPSVIVTNNVGTSGWGQGPQKLISVTPHCHCLITVNMMCRNLCPPDERTEYSTVKVKRTELRSERCIVLKWIKFECFVADCLSWSIVPLAVAGCQDLVSNTPHWQPEPPSCHLHKTVIKIKQFSTEIKT